MSHFMDISVFLIIIRHAQPTVYFCHHIDICFINYTYILWFALIPLESIWCWNKTQFIFQIVGALWWKPDWRGTTRKLDHAISCGIGGKRIARHDHVRDALFQTTVTAGLGPVKEPDGLLPGSDDRPADVLIPFWSGGRDAVLDFTMVNPLEADLVSKASGDASSTVQHTYLRIKVEKVRWQKRGGRLHLSANGSGHL